jgi:threonine/homoserine efflux transporter RhtA
MASLDFWLRVGIASRDVPWLAWREPGISFSSEPRSGKVDMVEGIATVTSLALIVLVFAAFPYGLGMIWFSRTRVRTFQGLFLVLASLGVIAGLAVWASMGLLGAPPTALSLVAIAWLVRAEVERRRHGLA